MFFIFVGLTLILVGWPLLAPTTNMLPRNHAFVVYTCGVSLLFRGMASPSFLLAPHPLPPSLGKVDQFRI